MAGWIQKQWLEFNFWHIFLLPISWLFGLITHVRRLFYKNGWLPSYRLNVPVIVVGNINVGGTGKTPLVIWLAEQLKLAGYKPGIISRGYGGTAQNVTEVLSSSSPLEVGDEPVLIAMRTACPVFVSANRFRAGRALLDTHPKCDVIISDDGLQHYRLQRDVEIIVYDGARGFGNGALLPAGPLRESKARLKTVDAIVSNGADVRSQQMLFDDGSTPVEMQLEAADFYNLYDNQIKCNSQALAGKKVFAIAGIGNPERFFQQLCLWNLNFEHRAYSDHYVYQAQDFDGITADAIVMTEKDAVKCKSFAKSNFWVLPVNAVIKNGLINIVLNKLNRLRS